MTIDERMKAEREVGRVTCGTTSASTLTAVADAFELATDPKIYAEITREEAHRLLVFLLHRDLAYDREIMAPERAEALAAKFLDETSRPDGRYFSNRFRADDAAGTRSWNPATGATFDAGVLVVSANGSACFWVEDED